MVTINYSPIIIYSNDVEFVDYKILNPAPILYIHIHSHTMENVIK